MIPFISQQAQPSAMVVTPALMLGVLSLIPLAITFVFAGVLAGTGEERKNAAQESTEYGKLPGKADPASGTWEIAVKVWIRSNSMRVYDMDPMVWRSVRPVANFLPAGR